jgi:hypothetical protein
VSPHPRPIVIVIVSSYSYNNFHGLTTTTNNNKANTITNRTHMRRTDADAAGTRSLLSLNDILDDI